jgi:hypothetical protein
VLNGTGTDMVVSLTGTREITEGVTMRFSAPPGSFHFFDVTNGRRIG